MSVSGVERGGGLEVAVPSLASCSTLSSVHPYVPCSLSGKDGGEGDMGLDFCEVGGWDGVRGTFELHYFLDLSESNPLPSSGACGLPPLLPTCWYYSSSEFFLDFEFSTSNQLGTSYTVFTCSLARLFLKMSRFLNYFVPFLLFFFLLMLSSDVPTLGHG